MKSMNQLQYQIEIKPIANRTRATPCHTKIMLGQHARRPQWHAHPGVNDISPGPCSVGPTHGPASEPETRSRSRRLGGSTWPVPAGSRGPHAEQTCRWRHGLHGGLAGGVVGGAAGHRCTRQWRTLARQQACRACPAIPVMHKPPGALRRVGRGSQRKGTCERALTCISPASHHDRDTDARLLLVPVGFVLIFSSSS
jgi:hypothetical protein